MITNKQKLIVGGVIAVAVYLQYLKTREFFTTALNPASDKNLAYSGVNGVGAKITGDENFTFGGWIYEKLNPGLSGNENKTVDQINSDLNNNERIGE
jgi:hypothetical protein